MPLPTALRSQYQKDRRARLWGTEPPEHGNPNAYDWYGCRCGLCREANIKRCKDYRARRKAKRENEG